MVINTRTYADFKLAAATLRKIDAVFYNDSATINTQPYGIVYAFDYQAGICVAAQISNVTLSGVATDFPSAIAIGDHLLAQDATALNTAF
jgi:hypothetical protein